MLDVAKRAGLPRGRVIAFVNVVQFKHSADSVGSHAVCNAAAIILHAVARSFVAMARSMTSMMHLRCGKSGEWNATHAYGSTYSMSFPAACGDIEPNSWNGTSRGSRACLRYGFAKPQAHGV